MSVLQKLFAGVATILVLALGAVLVVPMVIDWNAWKPEIEQAATDAGIRLRLNGDLSASLLPSPTLSIAGLVVEQAEKLESDDHFLTLGRADIKLAFAPLFGGKVRINSIALEDGHLVLHQNTEGQPVLPFGGEASGNAASAGNAAPSSVGGGSSSAGPDFRIDDISLSNLSFTLVTADGQRQDLVQVRYLQGGLDGLQGPVRASGAVTVSGQSFDIDVKTGLLRDGEDLPLRLGVVLQNGLSLTSNLRVADIYGDPVVTGKVTLSAADAAQTLQQSILKPGLALDATAGLRASAQEVALNDLVVSIGKTRLAGGVNLVLGDRQAVDISLNTSRANLDELLATPTKNAVQGKAASDAGGGASPPSSPTTKTAEPYQSPVPAFALPEDISASLTLQSDVLIWQDQAIRDIAIDLQMDSGVLDISKATAQLPGGTKITLAGLVTTPKAMPEIAGRFKVESPDIRGTAIWAGADLPDIRADRLQRGNLEGLFRVTPAVIQLYGLKGKLDSTSFSGAVTMGLRQRPAYGLELSLDHLSLSDYLPRENTGKTDAKGEENAASGQTVNKAPASPAPEQDMATQLAVVNNFDAQVKLDAGRLHYGDLTLHKMAVDGTLLRGKLDLRRLSVDKINRDGAFAASGTVEGFDETPLFDLKLDGRVGDLTDALVKAGQVKQGFPKLGKARLTGRFAGKAENLDLDAKLSVMGGAVSWKGNIAPLETSPRVDLVMSGAMPKLVPLMRMLDPTFKLAGKAKDQGFKTRMTLKGTPLLMKVDAAIDVAGGKLTAKGKLDTFGGPLLDGKVGLDAANGLAFLHGLGVDYHPAARNPGKLRLSTDIRGGLDILTLKNLGAQFGLLALNGQADVAMTGKRPKITGSFKAGDVFIDPYLPLSASLQQAVPGRDIGHMRRAGRNTRLAAASKNSRWSTEILDLSVMGLADADLDVTAKSIQQGRYIFNKPDLKLMLQDQVLTVKELKGGLFDGQALVTAVVDGRRLPTVSLQADVKDSQLEQVLRAAAGLDTATGTAGLSLNVSGQGRSQYDIVSSLKGSLTIASVQGVVRGINMQALNQGLHSGASDAGSVLRIALGSFAQGQTRYQTVGGAFDIVNGVMTSNNIVANLDGGTGRGSARIDLPAWFLDSKFRFKLTDQQSAPEFGLDLVGPLDQPQRKMRIDKLKAHFVGKGIEGLIKSIGNGASDGAEAPAKLLNNLFKNLQKR